MACGCSDNKKIIDNNKLDNSILSYNKLRDNKSLSLEDMKDMSIDKIVDLYKDGYRLDGFENNVDIISADWDSQCYGETELAFDNSSPLYSTMGGVQKGEVWAQRFYAAFRCLDTVQFSMKREANVHFYIEIRKDYGTLPQGVPLQNDAGLVYRTPPISYNDIPTTLDWVYPYVPALLPTNGYYWICFVPVDFYDSPIYRTLDYDRFDLQDGPDVSSIPSAFYRAGQWYNSSTFGFSVYKQPNYLTPSIADLFNMCWGSGLGGSCSMPTERPAIPTGTTFPIKADVFNQGGTGRIRLVFKINGSTILGGDLINESLGPYPSFWSPTVNYTMPASDVSLVVDGYGWDGANWTLHDTLIATIFRSAPACQNISLTPYSASIELGQNVTLTATVLPSTSVFTVNFRLVELDISLGTRSTIEGTCQLVWNTGNTPGLVAGTTYHVVAEIAGQCISELPGTGIIVSAPIQQWTLDVNIKDDIAHTNISGASVTVYAYGPPSGTQTSSTDQNGNVHFVVINGTIDVTISKANYNIRTINDSIYNNKMTTYYLIPVSQNPGWIQFVTIPPEAEIFFGIVSKDITDPITGVLVIFDLPANQVINYTVKKPGFNDKPGTVTVQGGSTLTVPVTLTAATPTTGDVCMKSNPSGATIELNGAIQSGKTTAASGAGYTSSNIIYNLPPILHNYVLSHDGYDNKPGNFTPIVGTIIDVDAGVLVPLQTVGNVTITSTPQAARIYILINGAYSDTHFDTPAMLSNLTVGSHTCKLVLDGYKDKTVDFIIQAVQTITVPNIVLEQRLGNLNFLSTPIGAEIKIGGISQGETTDLGLTVSNLPVGLTQFTATFVNYDNYNGSVMVEEDKTTDVSIILVSSVANKGSLYIDSTPQGAEIFIDGSDKNLPTPQTFAQMDLGGHTYKLTLSGYQPTGDIIFSINVGETTTITKTLQSTTGGGEGGAGILFGLLGIGAFAMMLSSKPPSPTIPPRNINK